MQYFKKLALPLIAAGALSAAAPVIAADYFPPEPVPRGAIMVPQEVVRTGPLTVEEAIAVAYGIGVVSVKNTHFDGDEWEIEGRDGYGKWIEVDVDARTGEVRNVDRSAL
jgi:hypothetical protein